MLDDRRVSYSRKNFKFSIITIYFHEKIIFFFFLNLLRNLPPTVFTCIKLYVKLSPPQRPLRTLYPLGDDYLVIYAFFLHVGTFCVYRILSLIYSTQFSLLYPAILLVINIYTCTYIKLFYRRILISYLYTSYLYEIRSI